MVKVLVGEKVIELKSLNDLDLEKLVVKCKSYEEDGDGRILAITKVSPMWKEHCKGADYTVRYGDYLD